MPEGTMKLVMPVLMTLMPPLDKMKMFSGLMSR